MKITVLGCGALGQLWLAALDRQGHEVQGWLRVPQPRCPVNLINIDGSRINKTFLANDPQFLGNSDLLLVALKAWQVSDAINNIQSLLPAQCPVLLLHNGMGTLEELRELTQPLLHGVTSHAAKRDGAVVVHVADGITHIGPGSADGAALSELAETLHQALPEVAWHNDVMAACWQKLAVNCVINPLSVLHDCLNGELIAWQKQIFFLCEEVATVMTREGMFTSAQQLHEHVCAVIARTAQNVSSMLQDVRAQRHTEIDYITGYLLQRARAHGIAVPQNIRLYEQIKRKEQNYERESISADLPGTWY